MKAALRGGFFCLDRCHHRKRQIASLWASVASESSFAERFGRQVLPSLIAANSIHSPARSARPCQGQGDQMLACAERSEGKVHRLCDRLPEAEDPFRAEDRLP